MVFPSIAAYLTGVIGTKRVVPKEGRLYSRVSDPCYKFFSVKFRHFQRHVSLAIFNKTRSNLCYYFDNYYNFKLFLVQYSFS